MPDQTPPLDLPELPPGESFYDRALPILKKAWARIRPPWARRLKAGQHVAPGLAALAVPLEWKPIYLRILPRPVVGKGDTGTQNRLTANYAN